MTKNPNKHELSQIAFNHLSDVDFKNFMNLYKKRTAKPYSFLITDTTLASDNPLAFRKNLLDRIKNLIVTIDDENFQYVINREAAKIAAFLSGETDKYEHLTGEKILPFDHRRMIEQIKFAYFPLVKALGKQKKRD